jgi:hypothetical protein
MSNVLLLPIFRYLLCPGSGKQTYLNHPSLKSTKLFYDFSHVAKITGMNPAARCVVHALRFVPPLAGFNLPIPARYASGIGVSQ